MLGLDIHMCGAPGLFSFPKRRSEPVVETPVARDRLTVRSARASVGTGGSVSLGFG
jgi:hypothetical protein